MKFPTEVYPRIWSEKWQELYWEHRGRLEDSGMNQHEAHQEACQRTVVAQDKSRGHGGKREAPWAKYLKACEICGDASVMECPECSVSLCPECARLCPVCQENQAVQGMGRAI